MWKNFPFPSVYSDLHNKTWEKAEPFERIVGRLELEVLKSGKWEGHNVMKIVNVKIN